MARLLSSVVDKVVVKSQQRCTVGVFSPWEPRPISWEALELSLSAAFETKRSLIGGLARRNASLSGFGLQTLAFEGI